MRAQRWLAALAAFLVASALLGMSEVPASAVHVVQVRAGGNHTCLLTPSGRVVCWGWNFEGRVRIRGLPLGVIAITTGGNHTCALTRRGGVKCWGDNLSGQLGDGSQHQRRNPVDVMGLTSGVAAISAGGDRSCALTDTGGVKCWGASPTGDGTWDRRLKPVAVKGLRKGVVAISVGSYHACALTRGHGLKCWGENYAGQLGDGTKKSRLAPVDVVGLGSGVDAVAAGGGHTCALTVGAGIECWGYNGGGQLGDGTKKSRLTPVDVVGLSSGVSSVTAGSGFSCATTDAGAAKCWGSNNFGQIGDGTLLDRLTPVDVVGLAAGATMVSGWGHPHLRAHLRRCGALLG